MTCVKLGNPAGELVPRVVRGGDLAEIGKKRRRLVICGCVAHHDQILHLAPNGLAALGQRGEALCLGLRFFLLAGAPRRIGLFLGGAFSLFLDAAGRGPQFTGGAAYAGNRGDRATGLPASPP
jgi:hypothetical protein